MTFNRTHASVELSLLRRVVGPGVLACRNLLPLAGDAGSAETNRNHRLMCCYQHEAELLPFPELHKTQEGMSVTDLRALPNAAESNRPAVEDEDSIGQRWLPERSAQE